MGFVTRKGRKRTYSPSLIEEMKELSTLSKFTSTATRRTQPCGRGLTRVLVTGSLTLALLLAGVLTPIAADQEVREQPSYYDVLRKTGSPLQNATSDRDEEEAFSNVFSVQDTLDGSIYQLAHLVMFLPLTYTVMQESNNDTVVRRERHGALNDMGAALMAIHHFNNKKQSPIFQRNTVLYEEVKDCPVRLTAEVFDTEFDPVVSTRIFTEMMDLRSGPAQSGNNTAHNNQLAQELPLPSGIVGAYRSAASSPLALLAAVKEIVQISPASTSTDLDDTEQYPLFARTCPSSIGESYAAVDYYAKLGVSHVAVLTIGDTFGLAMQRAFQDYASDMGIETISSTFSYSRPEEIPNAVAALERSKYTYFFVICFDSHFEPIMTAAHEEGLIGDDYSWIFYGPNTRDFQATREYQQGSALYNATKGIGLFEFVAQVELEPRTPVSDFSTPLPDVLESVHDNVRASWRQALSDPGMLDFFYSKIPSQVKASFPSSRALGDGHDRFTDKLPSWGHFMYDAVTALGIAMCRTNRTLFTGKHVIPEIASLRFNGTTGNVVFDKTGTRDYATTSFVVWNAQPFQQVGSDGLNKFTLTPTSYYSDGKWVDSPKFSFIYASGTSNQPKSLVTLQVDENLVPQGVILFGYIYVAVTALFAIVSIIFVTYFRNAPAICASQPTFLYMVAVGTMVQAFSVVPFSTQEPIDQRWLDFSCRITPWLMFIGFSITFSGIYIKTKRLYDIYLHPDLERIYVSTMEYVLWGVTLALFHILLLIIWTVLFPWKWSRIYGSGTDIFSRPTSSYGTCRHPGSPGDDPGGLILVAIMVSDFVMICIANWWSYRSRELETEYKESLFIGFALGGAFEALLIGAPLFYVVDASPEARYFVFIGMSFLMTLLASLLIIVPKMVAVATDRKQEKELAQRIERARSQLTAPEREINERSDEDSNGSRLETSSKEGETEPTAAVSMSQTVRGESLQSLTPSDESVRGRLGEGRADPGIRVLSHPRAESSADEFSVYSAHSGRYLPGSVRGS